VARQVAEQVICLPQYPALTFEQIDMITGLIAGMANQELTSEDRVPGP